jgi:hypothetical protein
MRRLSGRTAAAFGGPSCYLPKVPLVDAAKYGLDFRTHLPSPRLPHLLNWIQWFWLQRQAGLTGCVKNCAFILEARKWMGVHS